MRTTAWLSWTRAGVQPSTICRLASFVVVELGAEVCRRRLGAPSRSLAWGGGVLAASVSAAWALEAHARLGFRRQAVRGGLLMGLVRYEAASWLVLLLALCARRTLGEGDAVQLAATLLKLPFLSLYVFTARERDSRPV